MEGGKLIQNQGVQTSWSSELAGHRNAPWCFPERPCTFVFKGPWFSGMDYVLTRDPANSNHIFNTHFNYYPNGEYCREVTYGILGNGFLNGDLWKHQRRIGHAHMNNLQFHSSVAKWSREKVVNAILPLLLGTAENSDSVINLQDVFKRFTFDMTCLMILRLDPGSLSPNFPSIPWRMV